MVNVKSKSNARSGGAVTSPNVDFINTGHAAQSRYIAALVNPFAAPAVPIPDSFLKAHCAKAGYETSLTNVKKINIDFSKTADGATGNYTVFFRALDANYASIVTKSFTSTVGTRLVAAGLAFEDGAKASDVGGFVTYRQTDGAYDGTYEVVNDDARTERNYGYGSLTYNLTRRQLLEFEGDASTNISIEFSEPKELVVRWSAIMECDGSQGFVEGVVGQNDFIVTQTIQNHHAGSFGDTPHPTANTHLPPHLTDVAPHTTHHFSDMWHTAANWVSSAAGWAWKHKGQIQSWANKAEDVYRELSTFRGSITAARTGEIMSIGARAAPLLLA
jgi:hypothetical protein